MITKEAIEAAHSSADIIRQINEAEPADDWLDRAAAFAAMPGPAVNDFALPQDVIDSLIAIGPVEWGVSLTQSDEKHAADLMDTLRITREHFGMTDEETGIHGVYLSGTGIVLAHTGMSPNSPQHARILTGAWNMLVDHANGVQTTPAPDLASENERMRAALENIAAPRDCGCKPSCQCNTQESLEIEVEALRDIAKAALERT